MLITVPTTSVSLYDTLSTAQKSIVAKTSGSSGFEVIFQNLGSTAIYIDYGYGATATVAGGAKISANDTFSCNCQNLGTLNMISETSANANVRVLIVK